MARKVLIRIEVQGCLSSCIGYIQRIKKNMFNLRNGDIFGVCWGGTEARVRVRGRGLVKRVRARESGV